MATGRRPITSDKRPSATAAAAVTASIAAEIDNVAVRSSFLVAASWLGMKMKKVLKATAPAAIRAKPLMIVRRASPQRWDRFLDHLPALLKSKESARLADSAAYKPGDECQGQREDESQPPPANRPGIGS